MSRPTPDELYSRAHALVPSLLEAAPRCEEARTVPAATVKAFADAGLYRICQPAALGGFEYAPDVLFRASRIVARGCPSSAWCLGVVGVHNWEIGLLDSRAGTDVFGEDEETRLSSSYAPTGSIAAEEGGYRVSGRWHYSSGSDHCQWAILGAVLREPEQKPVALAVLVPRSDYEVVDNWNVAGLSGTGSHDIVVDDAFVPQHRSHVFGDSFHQRDPGVNEASADTYRYPFGTVFTWALSAVALGIAEAALETSIEQLTDRVGSHDRSAAAKDPFVQQRIAEARGRVDACRAMFDGVWDEMATTVSRREPIPVDRRLHFKWQAQRVARESAEVVTNLFRASGARGLRLESPLQRYFRDVHAACAHAFLNADRGAQNFGAVMLGGENRDFAL